MNNVKLNYLYRDGANYKNCGSVIFADSSYSDLAELKKLILSNLIEGTWFYADRWNLPDLHFDHWEALFDHDFHEYDCVEYTEEPPNTLITLAQFKNQLRILREHEL